MKCPLFGIYDHETHKDEVSRAPNCLQAECAWWDKVGKSCIVQAAGFFLGTIADILSEGGKHD